MPKQKGDHLTHDDWNRVERAATTPEFYNSADLPSPRMSPALVALNNATSAPVAEFSVYQVGPMFTRDGTAFVKGIWEEGVTFDGHAVTDATAPFAISQQPLNVNRVGTGIINGVTACKVSGTGPYAAPVAGQTYLQACECGPARVIFRNSGSGPQWAVVSVSQHMCGSGGSHGQWVFACLDEDLTPDESVTAKIWPDGDEEITVYAPPLLCEEEDIPACSMVLAMYQPRDGKYYAVIYGGSCNCSCGSEPGSGTPESSCEYDYYIYYRTPPSWGYGSNVSGSYVYSNLYVDVAYGIWDEQGVHKWRGPYCSLQAGTEALGAITDADLFTLAKQVTTEHLNNNPDRLASVCASMQEYGQEELVVKLNVGTVSRYPSTTMPINCN